MKHLIDRDALVAEIERRMKLRQDGYKKYNDANDFVAFEELEYLRDEFLPTLEEKDANEALRMEYEKGRADVIADTLSWLANCWPQYCSNQTIIEGFKEAMKE